MLHRVTPVSATALEYFARPENGYAWNNQPAAPIA